MNKISLVDYAKYLDEFEKWFQNILLNKTKSCNEREVFRNSKESLKSSYLKMCVASEKKE